MTTSEPLSDGGEALFDLELTSSPEDHRARRSVGRDAALCGQTDGSLFFPGKGEGTAAPLRVCRTCPVRMECLEDSLANQDWHGVRGGMSGEARRKLLVRNRPKPADPVEEIVRLRAKRWTTPAIALRLGVDHQTVWRALKQHREAAA